jgi:hypothetical protein
VGGVSLPIGLGSGFLRWDPVTDHKVVTTGCALTFLSPSLSEEVRTEQGGYCWYQTLFQQEVATFSAVHLNAGVLQGNTAASTEHSCVCKSFCQDSLPAFGSVCTVSSCQPCRAGSQSLHRLAVSRPRWRPWCRVHCFLLHNRGLVAGCCGHTLGARQRMGFLFRWLANCPCPPTKSIAILVPTRERWKQHANLSVNHRFLKAITVFSK